MTADNTAPTTRDQALTTALTKYAPETMERSPDDIAYIVREITEWESAASDTVDRNGVAYHLWTMGGRLVHRKCVADNEANYECVCEPCNTYLRAVADSILLAVLGAVTGTADEGATFRVIDTTRQQLWGQPYVDITHLPDLESAERYIRQLEEDDYPIDGLVIESRSAWRRVGGEAKGVDTDTHWANGEPRLLRPEAYERLSAERAARMMPATDEVRSSGWSGAEEAIDR